MAPNRRDGAWHAKLCGRNNEKGIKRCQKQRKKNDDDASLNVAKQRELRDEPWLRASRKRVGDAPTSAPLSQAAFECSCWSTSAVGIVVISAVVEALVNG